ncbi:MAG: FAD-dependent oxidoreductase [Bacilli bacterium]
MLKQSIWNINNKNNDFILEKDLKTDILIIGSGITGNTLAYLLDNKDITIIDDDLGKTTCKSTAKITFLQDCIYNNISKKKKDLYLKSQLFAIELIKKIIKDNNIKCNLEKTKMYLFTNSTKEVKNIKKIEKLLSKNNIPFTINQLLSYPNIYNISTDSYVFNPSLYLKQLKEINKNKNIHYYKNRYVKHLSLYNNYEVTLDNETIITCNTLIFTCHYPPFIYPLLIPFKVKLDKSFIGSITKENAKYSGINTTTPWQSFRFYKNNLIYLTNSNSVSKSIDNELEASSLINKTKEIFNEKLNYIWTNNDLISYDHLPIVGRIEKNNDKLLIACAYNTWGMTNGILSASILKDIIDKSDNAYIDLCNPHRFKNIKDYLNILIYSTMNGLAFTKSKLKLNYSFYKTAKVKKINGIRYGIYKDEQNKEHIVLNKCPHMKCNLIFNELEHTWDCPCHASRFDIDGNIIKGPSTYNIKVK